MARLTSDLVLSLTDRVSGPARGVEASLDRLKRQARSANSDLQRSDRLTARSAADMGRQRSMILAGTGYAAPLAAALGVKEAVTQAADFESALTNIQKKAGITREQTRKLGEDIKALATSGELAVPIEEIAAAYERGAAAGIPLEKLKEFALVSAKAADAFEMSATDVGNASAGFNKVLDIPMDKMQRYFDLINGLADSGIADESGIVDFIDQGGSMAKTFGLTVEQTAALGAALANLKVPAEKGATAMNSILTRLLAPDSLSDEGRAAFAALIGDTEAFAKSLKADAGGALLGVIKKLKTLDKAKRTELIVELFGQDHLDVMTQLVEGSEEVEKNFRYAAGTDWFGSLDKSYALKLDDMWSQWQLLKNDMSVLAIDVGTMGMPALKAGIEGLRDFVKEIQAGMEQLELNIDWTSIGEAKQAIGEFGTELGALLGIDTSKSSVAQFFKELADAINQMAGVIGPVATELKNIAKFIADPIGEITRKKTPEESKHNGVTIFTDADRARLVREKAVREQAEADIKAAAVRKAGTPEERQQRSVDNAKATQERVRAAMTGDPAPQPPAMPPGSIPFSRGHLGPNPDRLAPAPAKVVHDYRPIRGEEVFPPPGARGPAPLPSPRPRTAGAAPATGMSIDDAAIREVDQMLGELLVKKREVSEAFKISASPEAITTMRAIADEMDRLTIKRAQLEQGLASPASAPATVPIPTPRPDIVGPLTTEGAAATTKAAEIGAAILSAVSITATPTIATSSIDVAISRVNALAAALRGIPGLAAEASHAASRTRVDFDGLHADMTR